ncbi:hypothetical protein ACH4UM_18965 [Streptomyces sp. NPDC020801]|uniref:hypothetical protein n=1 Tax=Streptomyces sp. NPDC020801 TaxID=3365093 RepID=UPI0037BC4C42
MPDRHRLVLRGSGDPATFTVELDGEPLTFVSRVELVVDARGAAEVRLTVPGALVETDADVEAFVAAHTPADDSGSTHEPTVHVALSDIEQHTLDAAVRRVLRHVDVRRRPR